MDGFSAALAGPPRAFVLDGDTYHLRADAWSASARLLVGYEDQRWPLAMLQALLESDSWTDLVLRCIDVDDPLDMPDLARVVQTLVGAAYGRDWWAACRLVGATVAQWGAVDGRLSLRGVDLLALLDSAPSRAANLIYAMFSEHAEEQDKHRLDAELERPPAGVLAAGWSDEAEGDAFLAAMQAAPARTLAD